MTIARQMTADELSEMPDSGSRYELVEGELITMPPAGEEHGEIVSNASYVLTAYIRAQDLGKTFAAETGFLVRRNPDTVRAPDFAFVPRDRLLAGKPSTRFSTLVPALVLEVLSPRDSVIDIDGKIDDWFDHGVDEVWVINPRRQSLTVHAKGRDPHKLHSGDMVRGSGALEGFSHPVSDLFSG